MKVLNFKLYLPIIAAVLLTACSNFSAEVENKMDELQNKTVVLDSLINKEVDKVFILDSLINGETDKLKKLDTLINKTSSKLDSVATDKIKRLKVN